MSGKNTSITLSDRQIEFAKSRVASGSHATISEVIRDAMRLLEEREVRLEALREAIKKGEESGPAKPFDFDKFIAERFPDA